MRVNSAISKLALEVGILFGFSGQIVNILFLIQRLVSHDLPSLFVDIPPDPFFYNTDVPWSSLIHQGVFG